ncbi:uncharacterized protein LOC18422250 [Amborella trichopoda]|uniref:DUF679 domain-containing protein n=1 Tax=Amborella trichopoda TaxID=13333 RepID=W1NG81_AMBTC|nr:uncharacterized protein LOC18422250 [Amborella trichopoda]ERM94501.1 hypothetical protein AMTR_s00010p00262790 [Amborella trichopoda]|eukprot:XP_006827264.1 uncharacterized protein LOC18422250 [Amborella trichopoda]
MEEIAGVAVKIYDSMNQDNPNNDGVPQRGRKRQAIAKKVQKTFARTSMLVNFLPTGTLLTFEMLLPTISNDGQCTHVSTIATHALLGLCAASCFLFHFTDSFRASDGKVYYGFVTPSGLSVFKSGVPVEVPKDERFRIGFVDLLHALMSVLVFVSIAFSDHRVVDCLLPKVSEKDMKVVMDGFPVMVGIICSGLFFVFPNTRYGVGCMAA